MSLADTDDGINEPGWDRAMAKPAKRIGHVAKRMKRAPKPTTMTVQSVHDAIRAESNGIFGGLVRDLARARDVYARCGADSLREAITREAGYSWGMLLGLRCAVYGVRRECDYGGADWQMFEALIVEIGSAMAWVQGVRS